MFGDSNFGGALSGAAFGGGSVAPSVANVTNTFANTAGSLFEGKVFKGITNIASRGLDSASKVAVTATALGKIASGNLSPGGTLAALAATPIGSELIGTVASEVTDSITGLVSEETSAFLTDNFDTIVDLGQAGFQIANGDKILGLLTGVTATFNAFNEDTHIDIGDYSVSVPQITNTLADVIATGLTAPTTQAGYILSGAKLLALTDPIGALTDSDSKISKYLYDSITVDANGDFTTAGLERQTQQAVLDASEELGERLGEDVLRQQNLLADENGKINLNNPVIMPTLIEKFKSTKNSQIFNPGQGWDFVAKNNNSNYYASGGIRKDLVEEVFN